MNIDQQLDAKQARRQAAHARALDRLERREAAAAAMIGELADGRCYVWPAGGRYREGDRADLIAFLLRNRYV
jgi:hypothetical protein